MTRALRLILAAGFLVGCQSNNSGNIDMNIVDFTQNVDLPLDLSRPDRTFDFSVKQCSIPAGTKVKSISTGGGSSCALFENGAIKCWGINSFGQLGNGEGLNRGDGPGEMGGNLPCVDLGPGKTAVSVAVGIFHACAILDDGSIRCWGANNRGQLGYNDTTNRTMSEHLGLSLLPVNLGSGRTAKALALSAYHTCAILDNDQVKCWGTNNAGQLGIGNTDDQGDGPGDEMTKLPTVDLGTGRTAKAIAAGLQHTCAILDDNSVKCWGQGQFGQLGYGDAQNRGDQTTNIDMGVDAGSCLTEMGDCLPTVDLGTVGGVGSTDMAGAAKHTAKKITAGAGHTCVILEDNSVKCWGYNLNAELGQGDFTNRGAGANEMGDNLHVVDLGAGRTAVDISTINAHVCAILDNQTLKCWGAGSGGALGLGDSGYRGGMPGQMGDNLPVISLGTGLTPRTVHTGYSFTCSLLSNDKVKCWGLGQYGRLGLGDELNRGDKANQMGDALPFVDLQ